MRRSRSLAAASLIAAGLLAGCGGSSSSSPSTAAPTTAAPTVTAAPTTEAPGGDYDEGSIGYRVLNVLDRPVDVFVRTTGLVQAFAVDLGLAPGEVSGYHFPPEGGRLIITEGGAGDPECVTGCDHFIAEAGPIPEAGDTRTLVVYQDQFSDRGLTFDVWENAADGTGTSNAMPPADPSRGIVIPLAVALTDADFGFQLAFDGISGCQTDGSLLVGGNQTPPFPYDGNSVGVALHSNQDRSCTEAPEGGPFVVNGGPGTRIMLVLTGTRNDMDAIQLTIGGEGAPSGGDGLYDVVISKLADEIAGELGLPAADAECVATVMVDAVDPTELLDSSGNLADIDALSPALQDTLTQALIDSVDVCGLDPSVLGG